MEIKEFIGSIKAATPFLMLSFFLVLFYSMFFLLDIHEMPVTNDEQAADYKWRLFWVLSVVLLLISMLWSYTGSSKLIQKYLSEDQSKAKLSIKIFLITIAVVIAFFPFDFGGSVGESLQQSIYAKTKINIPLITSVMNVLAVITIIAMVIAVSLLLINIEENEVEIQRTTVDIHRSLYSSSVLLAAGILEIFCLYSWPATFDSAKSYQAEASGVLIIAAGLFFSLMLAVIYVPLFMSRNEALNKHMSKLKFSSKDELENWYAINYLEKDAGTSPNDIIAFILPIVTGVVIKVFSAQIID